MNSPAIAVLSYHGWEIDPERLLDDVRDLREGGWRDVSLGELEGMLDDRAEKRGRFFHVTADDGYERNGDFVAALRSVSSCCTLFISLGAMNEKALAVHRAMLSWDDVCVEDHSLRHTRIFHYRRVIGFHSDARPLMSSPEQMQLDPGSLVCIFGGELVRPRFIPSERAVAVCRDAARSTMEKPGSASWNAEMSRRLIDSKFGFHRLGRLCIEGRYESKDDFQRRVRSSLEEGRRRFMEFAGRPPMAFAHPWWQAGCFAEECLRDLGYRMSFTGRGMTRGAGTFGIPRLFVNNQTPRPLDLKALAAAEDAQSRSIAWREIARRVVYR